MAARNNRRDENLGVRTPEDPAIVIADKEPLTFDWMGLAYLPQTVPFVIGVRTRGIAQSDRFKDKRKYCLFRTHQYEINIHDQDSRNTGSGRDLNSELPVAHVEIRLMESAKANYRSDEPRDNYGIMTQWKEKKLGNQALIKTTLVKDPSKTIGIQVTVDWVPPHSGGMKASFGHWYYFKMDVYTYPTDANPSQCAMNHAMTWNTNAFRVVSKPSVWLQQMTNNRFDPNVPSFLHYPTANELAGPAAFYNTPYPTVPQTSVPTNNAMQQFGDVLFDSNETQQFQQAYQEEQNNTSATNSNEYLLFPEDQNIEDRGPLGFQSKNVPRKASSSKSAAKNSSRSSSQTSQAKEPSRSSKKTSQSERKKESPEERSERKKKRAAKKESRSNASGTVNGVSVVKRKSHEQERSKR